MIWSSAFTKDSNVETMNAHRVVVIGLTIHVGNQLGELLILNIVSPLAQGGAMLKEHIGADTNPTKDVFKNS